MTIEQHIVDLLILGGSGFIGARTVQAALAQGQSVACTARSHPAPDGAKSYPFDIVGPEALNDLVGLLAKTQPKAVIHSVVGWNLADESEQLRMSSDSLTTLINALRVTGLESRIIYVSTNAVFSGKQGLYREDAVPDTEARSDGYRFYGMGRRAGERLALEAWPNSIIARTANVDGRDAWGMINPRLMRLIEPLKAGQALRRYTDRTISPTLVDNVAECLVEIANPQFTLPEGRILHIAGREPMTDYGYAQRLAGVLGVPRTLVQADHYLPEGATDRYDISLDVSYTQSLLRTHLMDVDGLLDTIFSTGQA